MSMGSPTASKGIVIPPWVYLIPSAICLLFWLIGTSVQVQTSEAWMNAGSSAGANVQVFSTFMQVWYFFHGQLASYMVVPFIFAWGVQVALIVASFGAELPRHPAWRHNLAWGTIVLMIFVNACGDWNYSSSYGFWGQLGFSVAIMFLTFACGFLAIACFLHAIRKMHA